MKTKKLNRILSICFVLVLAGCALVSGTLAMTSDKSERTATNKDYVDVTLVQQQRAFDTNGHWILTDFTDNKILIPLSGSAKYNGSNFDKYGMPKADGYQDQIVRVRNDGNVAAYVRVLISIPSKLDNMNEAGKKALHWDMGERFMPNGDFHNDTNNIVENYDQLVAFSLLDTVNVDGESYNRYVITYTEPLASGAITNVAAFTGFYLDDDVDVVNGHVLLDNQETGYESQNITVNVAVQAIQTTGFTSAEDAFSHYTDETN